MKNQLKKIATIFFAVLIVCPCVTADERFDLDMVKIPGKNFSMLRTEVTQELYEAVMEENPSYFCHDNKNINEDKLKKLNKSTSNYPVENVSWYDAIYFCNKLSEKKGLQPVYAVDGETSVYKWDYEPHNNDKIYSEIAIAQNIFADGYRLPTVAEWQYAAKGGEDYRYSGSNNIDSIGWYCDNSGGVIHPIAQKKPNGYGLYDMSGNVSEWCWSYNVHGYRYYCGGSWDDYDSYCEVDDRSDSNADYSSFCMGFRIVRSTGK